MSQSTPYRGPMHRSARHGSRSAHNYDLRRRVLINNFIRTQTQMWMEQQFLSAQTDRNSNGSFSDNSQRQFDTGVSNGSHITPSLAAASVCSDGRTPFTWTNEDGTNSVNSEEQDKENTNPEEDEEVSASRPIPKSPGKKRRRSHSSSVGGVFRALSRRLRTTESSQLRQQVKARSTRSRCRSRQQVIVKEKRVSTVVTVPSLYSSEEQDEIRSSTSFVNQSSTQNTYRRVNTKLSVFRKRGEISDTSQVKKRPFLKLRKSSAVCIKPNIIDSPSISEKSCRIKRMKSPIMRRSSLRRAFDRLISSAPNENSTQQQKQLNSSLHPSTRSCSTSVSGTSFFSRLFGNSKSSKAPLTCKNNVSDNIVSGRVATVTRSRSLQERTQTVKLPRRRKSVCVRIPEVKFSD